MEDIEKKISTIEETKTKRLAELTKLEEEKKALMREREVMSETITRGEVISMLKELREEMKQLHDRQMSEGSMFTSGGLCMTVITDDTIKRVTSTLLPK